MSGQGEVLSGEEVSATYAGFAGAFRYPEGPSGVMSGAEYLEAFDPSASDRAVSVHEAAHVSVEASALFEELVRFYEHFGLRRNSDAELPDHLSIELEFMHFLCELERHTAPDSEDMASLRNAQRDFLDRHVLRVLHGVRDKLNDDEGIARGLVLSCLDFVDQHRQDLTAG